MPEYIFQCHNPTYNSIAQRSIHCSVDEIEDITKRMKKRGWRRMWFSPGLIVVPGFQEAYDESVKVAEDNDRKSAQMQKDNMEEVARLIEEGHGED